MGYNPPSLFSTNPPDCDEQSLCTRQRHSGSAPKALIAVAVALTATGWLAIARSDEIVGGQNHLVGQQIVWAAVGLAAMAGFGAG